MQKNFKRINKPHGVQESAIDSLSKEAKLARYKQEANIPWSNSTQCIHALASNQQAVAEYIILKVGRDEHDFGRLAVKAILDVDWHGSFKLTAKRVTTWKLENSIAYQFGNPMYKLPPLFMTLMENLLTGHYGELTGYRNPPPADEEDKKKKRRALKKKETPVIQSEEEIKKEWIRLQFSSIRSWFKDRAHSLRKKTYVSMMAVIWKK